MSRGSSAWIACVLVLGCSGDRAGGSSTSSTVSAPSSSALAAASVPIGSAVRPDEGGMPEPVLIPAIEKICKEAPCSGERARIRVFRSGPRITAYLHHPDPSSCTHPPSVYFDREGKQLGSLAEHPTAPASASANVADAQARHGGGGTPSETIDCKGAPVR